jgi:hypothetical protein
VLVQVGDFVDCWSFEDFATPQPIDRTLVGVLKDDTPLPKQDDLDPLAVDETAILHYALRKSIAVPPAAFDPIARSNLDVEDLDSAPGKYRGLIVRIDARPKRVREMPAPERLRHRGAVKLYEVWALARVGEVHRAVCLITPVPPPGLVVGDEQPDGVEVALSGFFLKKLKVAKADGVKGFRTASVPLLVGVARVTLTQEVRMALAAASLLGAGIDSAGSPLTTAMRLRDGERASYWTIEDPDRVPPLDRRYLSAVKDEQGLPRGFEVNDQDTEEKFAYTDAIIKAHRTPLARFRKSVDRDVTFAQLHTEPARYRGKVVRIEGYLQRVMRHEPDLQEQQAGIKNVYEIWLVNTQHKYNNPALLICTQLPEGVKVTDEVKGDVPVVFMGYFFKKYFYQLVEKGKVIKYYPPLMVGHLVYNKPTEAAAKESWTGWLLPLFLTFFAGSLALVFLLTWGFRKADKRVQSRLDASAPPFVAASEPEDSPSPSESESEPPLDSGRRI